MAADPKQQIGEIAAFFKNQDTLLYEKFLRALDAYVFDVTVAVTNAPSADILQAQGRAQQARLFMRIFSEAKVPTQPTP